MDAEYAPVHAIDGNAWSHSWAESWEFVSPVPRKGDIAAPSPPLGQTLASDRRRVEWPDSLPHPAVAEVSARTGSEPSNEEVATELFLCASAWILHHELAHLRLQHPLVTTNSVAEEREADQAATGWILDSYPGEPRTLKRGLGIAVAVVALAVLQLESPALSNTGVPQTHPGVADRLFHALDHPAFGEDHQVFDFVVHSLKLHFDHVGIEADGEYDNARDCFHDYCMTLHRLDR